MYPLAETLENRNLTKISRDSVFDRVVRFFFSV